MCMHICTYVCAHACGAFSLKSKRLAGGEGWVSLNYIKATDMHNASSKKICELSDCLFSSAGSYLARIRSSDLKASETKQHSMPCMQCH